MGLAASQARFLGITLRKANCEFKSTELAQQRLELTNQMTDISQEYANALNATKLVWSNGAVCDSFGNPVDMGLSYTLLMMPSAANDFNPYMVSSRSGAIVLNAKYADAARLAGISMAGSTPTEEGRNKFLAALANKLVFANSADAYAKGDNNNNIITEHTYYVLSEAKNKDGVIIAPAQNGADVKWHSSAGMGAVPKDKGIADVTKLTDLLLDNDIGQRKVDWLEIYKNALGKDGTTEISSEEFLSKYKEVVTSTKLKYINYGYEHDNHPSYDEIVSMQLSAKDQAKSALTGSINSTNPNIMEQFKMLENTIASQPWNMSQYQEQLELLKQGYEIIIDGQGNSKSQIVNNNDENLYKYPMYWAIYEQTKAEIEKNKGIISWNSDDNVSNANSVGIKNLFYTEKNEIGGGGSNGNKGINLTAISNTAKLDYLNILTLCVNNSIIRDTDYIKGMTIADLLTEDVTLIAQKTPKEYADNKDNDPNKTIELAAKAILTSVASVLGYGNIGTGLNVDTTSNKALEDAYAMTIRKFLKSGNAVKGNKAKDNSLVDNSAYINARDYNRIGQANDEYSAINLSNMISAFLTYYDNALRGAESDYVVAKANTDGRTFYVTDDPNYVYVTNSNDGVTNDEKIADFYNQLYNNICAHGWRYDDMVMDGEYFESAIKDGRYQLMALNSDGYFYQERYNDVGYLEEVQDKDAIARAEVDFQIKKSQITFKEDQIDIKTKKLDAEISELNTEINSVQNIISKSIEKTFSMFSN